MGMATVMAYQQGFHSGNLKDHTIESRQLENCHPRVDRRIVNCWYLDNTGDDGQNQVQPVHAHSKEATPVRQVRDDTNDHLNVERNGEPEFTLVHDGLVCSAAIDVTCAL
jgi:hypothetical protein